MSAGIGRKIIRKIEIAGDRSLLRVREVVKQIQEPSGGEDFASPAFKSGKKRRFLKKNVTFPKKKELFRKRCCFLKKERAFQKKNELFRKRSNFSPKEGAFRKKVQLFEKRWNFSPKARSFLKSGQPFGKMTTYFQKARRLNHFLSPPRQNPQ